MTEKLRIGVMGCGYVGLVTAACLAKRFDVVGFDVDITKVRKLNAGACPIHEPGLPELLGQGRAAQRLLFTDDPRFLDDVDVIFVCVGTPPTRHADGHVSDRTNLQYVFAAAETAARRAPRALLVVKSTVPPGTNAKIAEHILQWTREMDVASNPEFLREGSAIHDFEFPDRVVIGTRTAHSRDTLQTIFCAYCDDEPRTLCYMSPESAELTKYAANAMLATRISLMNEVAWLCEKSGADVLDVASAVGLDPRIGSAFLSAGIGYGGSCFPKDVKALSTFAEDVNESSTRVLWAVDKTNQRVPTRFAERIIRLHGYDEATRPKRAAVWGLAFKPDTDDVREAPASAIIARLAEASITVTSFDPVVGGTHEKMLDAADGVQVLIVCTEWASIRDFEDWAALRTRMATGEQHIFDGRNVWAKKVDAIREAGFIYHGVGRFP